MLNPKQKQWIPGSLRFIGSVSFIVCLVLASVMWFLQKLSNTADKNIYYQLEYILPETKTFAKIPPTEIITNIEGPGFNLFLNPKRQKLEIPLSENHSQVLTRNALSEFVRTDLQETMYTFNSLESSGIQISLDDLMVKKVPFRFEGIIEPAAGYKVLGGIQSIPDSIEVSGPKSTVRHIDSWRVFNQDYENWTERISEIIDLQADSLQLISLSTGTVELSVNIDAVTEKSIVLDVITSNDSIQSIPKRAELVFELGLSEFENYNEGQFELTAEEKESSEGQTKAKLVLIKHPSSITKYRMIPDSVELIYQTKKGQ